MVKATQRPGNGSRMKETEMRDFSAGKAAAHVDPRVQNEIGKHLRAIYDDVINEPVPNKFMDLLEQLERSTTRGR